LRQSKGRLEDAMDAAAELEKMLEFFEDVEDPRREHPTTLHPLGSIIAISVCAVISGAEGFRGIYMWADDRQDWLEEVLWLPSGIPSEDTIGRVFGLIDSAQFGRAFRKWTQTLAMVHEEMIAFDGKTLTGSGADKDDCVEIVNAWAAQNDLVVAQVSVKEDSNEIPALNRAIRLLDVEGLMVTIDAIGCQSDMATEITTAGGDYLLRVKSNQGNLHDEIRGFFEWAADPERPDDQQVELGYAETIDGGHGRVTTRRCWVTEDLEGLSKASSWPDIQGLVMVETHREKGDEVETQKKYYVTSTAAQSDNDAEYLLGCARDHWGIENKVHWVLDVGFSEDQSRVQKRNAAANLSAVRKMAKNLLDKESSANAGVKNKRLKASRNTDYLMKVLEQFEQWE
jgi:predicted transposase YbfD/YdcC